MPPAIAVSSFLHFTAASRYDRRGPAVQRGCVALRRPTPPDRHNNPAAVPPPQTPACDTAPGLACSIHALQEIPRALPAFAGARSQFLGYGVPDRRRHSEPRPHQAPPLGSPGNLQPTPDTQPQEHESESRNPHPTGSLHGFQPEFAPELYYRFAQLDEPQCRTFAAAPLARAAAAARR